MHEPNALHRRLAALAGDWRGIETMAPSRWLPERATGEARIVNRLEAADFVLAQSYEQTQGGRTTYAGHGVFWVDQSSQKVRLDWWDNYGGARQAFEGEWEGDTLTLRAHGPMGHSRSRWTLTDTGCERRFEHSQDGEHWTEMMRGTYTRQPD